MISPSNPAVQRALRDLGPRRLAGDDQQRFCAVDDFNKGPSLNIGVGIFQHQARRNLDFLIEHDSANSPSIEWDLNEFRPLYVESGTIDTVYSSHAIEHVQDRHARHMLAEAYRVLAPGGTIRLTCPDIALYHRAYLAGDVGFFPHGEVYAGSSIEQRLLIEFATLMSSACGVDVETIKIGDDEIRARLGSDLDATALDDFCQRIDYDRFYKTFPGARCNWWTRAKAISFLREAGFSEITHRRYCQSAVPVLRNVPPFDRHMPTQSLCVKAVKPLGGFVSPVIPPF